MRSWATWRVVASSDQAPAANLSCHRERKTLRMFQTSTRRRQRSRKFSPDTTKPPIYLYIHHKCTHHPYIHQSTAEISKVLPRHHQTTYISTTHVPISYISITHTSTTYISTIHVPIAYISTTYYPPSMHPSLIYPPPIYPSSM
jgi:hypothetical protein